LRRKRQHEERDKHGWTLYAPGPVSIDGTYDYATCRTLR
jgi:hypothetical protein